jgi:DNA-binding GntR family transcriptional regulator
METCREHRAVFRAVREGDLDWAASLLRRHLDISSKVSPYSEPPNAEGEIVQGAPEYMIKLTH